MDRQTILKKKKKSDLVEVLVKLDNYLSNLGIESNETIYGENVTYVEMADALEQERYLRHSYQSLCELRGREIKRLNQLINTLAPETESKMVQSK